MGSPLDWSRPVSSLRRVSQDFRHVLRVCRLLGWLGRARWARGAMSGAGREEGQVEGVSSPYLRGRVRQTSFHFPLLHIGGEASWQMLSFDKFAFESAWVSHTGSWKTVVRVEPVADLPPLPSLHAGFLNRETRDALHPIEAKHLNASFGYVYVCTLLYLFVIGTGQLAYVPPLVSSYLSGLGLALTAGSAYYLHKTGVSARIMTANPWVVLGGGLVFSIGSMYGVYNTSVDSKSTTTCHHETIVYGSSILTSSFYMIVPRPSSKACVLWAFRCCSRTRYRSSALPLACPPRPSRSVHRRSRRIARLRRSHC